LVGEKGSLEARFMELQDKNLALTADLEKLALALRQKNSELETIRQTNRQLHGQISDRAVLEQEIMKLKGILEGKLGELEDLRGERGALEYRLAQKSEPDTVNIILN
jgi:chromosome segregation ATPase